MSGFFEVVKGCGERREKGENNWNVYLGAM
jgi:hypothetical protein